MIKFDTIGSDPEFLIHNGEEFLPSFMFIKGTKKNPENKGNGFAILKDNLLIEGNIPPARERDEFIGYMTLLKGLINDVLEVGGAKLFEDDIAAFEDKYIFTHDGLEFGCSNYMDAYQNLLVRTPELPGNNRTVGCEAV